MEKFIQDKDEIIITELEHHANYVPWHFLRKRKGAVIKFAECDKQGEVSIDPIKQLITNKTKLIAVTHVSNVTGTIMPLSKIIDLAKTKKIPVLIDGCQGAPHIKLDMQKLIVIFTLCLVIKCMVQQVLVYFMLRKNG